MGEYWDKEYVKIEDIKAWIKSKNFPEDKMEAVSDLDMLIHDGEMSAYSEYEIFCKRDEAYSVEDAISQVETYLEWRGVDVEKGKELFDMEFLAKQFRSMQDCNVADNDTWDFVVKEYIERKGLEKTLEAMEEEGLGHA